MTTAASVTTPLIALLDEMVANVHAENFLETLRLVHIPLRNLYLDAVAKGFEAEFIAAARQHPLYEIAKQDPFTKRCSDKPRGYAGDAVMLDYIYSRTPPADTTAVGHAWFDYTTVGAMALSVRYRRALLNTMIDDTVTLKPNYQILSVASGHCRELEKSLVLSNRFNGKFVALDQDEESCKAVKAEYAAQADDKIEVVNVSVRALLGQDNPLQERRFDFIYSAGLYDYLNERAALALTTALRSMLKPGGKLLIANFVPESESRGYAAAFMDWQLIYRTPAELAATFGEEAVKVRTQLDPHRNVVYATFDNV
jgi:extracellular factor (EF) 3-hydroxypalmitic acid methyl ester biosynthesis protein